MKYLWLILMVFMIGSQDTGQRLPTGAVPVKPPIMYRAYFQEVENCSGFTGDFDAIQWYIVPGVDYFEDDNSKPSTQLTGVTILPERIIVIAGNQISNAYVVRHELLHVLANTTQHPPEIFGWTAPCAYCITHWDVK